MIDVDTCNCFREEKLSLLEISIFNNILKTFRKGLANDNIRKDRIQGLGIVDGSF